MSQASPPPKTAPPFYCLWMYVPRWCPLPPDHYHNFNGVCSHYMITISRLYATSFLSFRGQWFEGIGNHFRYVVPWFLHCFGFVRCFAELVSRVENIRSLPKSLRWWAGALYWRPQGFQVLGSLVFPSHPLSVLDSWNLVVVSTCGQ